MNEELSPLTPVEVTGPPEPAPAVSPATPWSLRDLALFLLFLLPAFLFATLSTTTAYGLLRLIFRWKPIGDMAHNAFFLVPMQTFFYAFILAFLNGITVFRYRTNFWRVIPWLPITLADRVGYLFGGWLLAVGVQLASALAPPKQKLPLDQLFSGPAAAYLLAVFGVLIAPFVEEMVFRGFIFAIFHKLGGVAAAVVSSGLLFGAIHVPQLWGGWMQMALLFGVGIVFGVVRARSGSIVPSLLMHICYNFTIFVYFYLSTDGFRHITG